jgi:uncharacterized protein YdcH (DUF465 family)
MPILAEYNKAIENFYSAVNTMEDMTISSLKKDKWEPRFKELLANLNSMVHEIEKQLGREMTEDEILNGFKEGLATAV